MSRAQYGYTSVTAFDSDEFTREIQKLAFHGYRVTHTNVSSYGYSSPSGDSTDSVIYYALMERKVT